jgi:hypothetical protein
LSFIYVSTTIVTPAATINPAHPTPMAIPPITLVKVHYPCRCHEVAVVATTKAAVEVVAAAETAHVHICYSLCPAMFVARKINQQPMQWMKDHATPMYQ